MNDKQRHKDDEQNYTVLGRQDHTINNKIYVKITY